MTQRLRSKLSAHALPLLGALAVGGLALLVVWRMASSMQMESYDPAKHNRVRVVTVDQAKLRECLAQHPGEQRASLGYQRCTDGYVYERGQDFFIPKAEPAGP